MTRKSSSMEKSGEYQEFGTDKDLANEEVFFDILERGVPEEIERFRG